MKENGDQRVGSDSKNEQLEAAGVNYEIVSESQGTVEGTDGKQLEVDHHFATTDPVLFDAIYAVGGPAISDKFAKKASKFIGEAFDHFKPIGATHDGMKWLEAAHMQGAPGIVTGEDMDEFASSFIQSIAQHRFWERQVE